MSETEFLSGGRQTIVSRVSVVMCGFIIEISSVKVKREERNKERTKLFETERTQTGSVPWTAHWSNHVSQCITGLGHDSHQLEQNNLVFVCALTSSEKSAGD